MGSCASVRRTSEQNPNMKLTLSFGPRNDKLQIISPINTKPANTPSLSTITCKEYGIKEEAFFDSQPWLESDGEDDFFSVDGEFTPSHGNSPAHRSYSVGTPPTDKLLNGGGIIPCSITQASPTKKKKKLLELFQENKDNEDVDVDDHNMNCPPISAQGTPCISETNFECKSEGHANEDPIALREKSMKPVQYCCLPSLAYCGSFSERRKKMSPAIAVNGKTYT